MSRGRPAKYPWALWLDGTRHVIHQSDDWQMGSTDIFPATVKVASFRAECHAAAKRKGGSVDTRIQGNTVILRFIEES
jgi:hypothetical protein